VIDYTAAPIYFSEQSNGAHEWLVEFEKEPDSLEQFTKYLDEALKNISSDYEAKRHRDIALSLPRVHILPNGSFTRWLRSKNKIGGQHKVPRLSNERIILEEILAISAIIHNTQHYSRYWPYDITGLFIYFCATQHTSNKKIG
jgi:hypothetical protein